MYNFLNDFVKSYHLLKEFFKEVKTDLPNSKRKNKMGYLDGQTIRINRFRDLKKRQYSSCIWAFVAWIMILALNVFVWKFVMELFPDIKKGNMVNILASLSLVIELIVSLIVFDQFFVYEENQFANSNRLILALPYISVSSFCCIIGVAGMLALPKIWVSSCYSLVLAAILFWHNLNIRNYKYNDILILEASCCIMVGNPNIFTLDDKCFVECFDGTEYPFDLHISEVHITDNDDLLILKRRAKQQIIPHDLIKAVHFGNYRLVYTKSGWEKIPPDTNAPSQTERPF